MKVEIVEIKTQKIIKSISCIGKKYAEKIQLGVEINLNFDEYFTRIVDDESI